MKFICLALLLLFQSIAAPPALDIRDFECELSLRSVTKSSLEFSDLQTFLGYRFEIMDGGKGFLFGPRRQFHSAAQVRYLLGSTPATVFRTEVWRAQNREFKFVDVGFKSLERDSLLIHRAILWHIRNHPNATMFVEFSPVQSAYRSWLQQHRWSFHDAVLSEYFKAKGYLKDVDRYLLELPNRRSSNNDVFGILSHHLENRDESGLAPPAGDLLLSIQLSYFGNRNFFEPSAPELSGSSIQGPVRPGENFPFEYRLDSSQRVEFLSGLYGRFDMHRTAEVTRYARFAKVPWSIHSRLLERTLMTAVARGMRTLLVSADSSTERLFRRYGFRRYAELPTRQNMAREYLMYLEMPSHEYDRFLSYLRTSFGE